MIKKEDFDKITSKEDRFEISMVYMLLSTGYEFENLDLDIESTRRIINSVKYVTQHCDYNSIKEGGEYTNIEIGDKTRKAWQDLKDRNKRDIFRRQNRGKVWNI